MQNQVRRMYHFIGTYTDLSQLYKGRYHQQSLVLLCSRAAREQMRHLKLSALETHALINLTTVGTCWAWLPEGCGKSGVAWLQPKHLTGVQVSECSDLLLHPISVPVLNLKHVLPSLIYCSSKLSISLSNVPKKDLFWHRLILSWAVIQGGKTYQIRIQGEVSAQSNPHPTQKGWEIG